MKAKEAQIPLHNFAYDDETSIPFEIRPLENRNYYDATEPHRHNYYEIFLFVRGGGKHLIDFTEYRITDNSLHFVSPGQVHLVSRDLSSHGKLISFSREFYLENPEQKERLYQMPFLHNYTAMPIFSLCDEAFNELLLLAQQMEKEASLATYPGLREILHAYLDIFLIKCQAYCDESEEKNQPPTAEQKLTRDFYQLLDNHFQEWHQVQDYASALYVTPRRLNEAISRHTGTNCSEIIANRILLEAKRLVKYTDFTVKEIAWFLHFEDPAYFNRYFKKHTGMTPMNFKKYGK